MARSFRDAHTLQTWHAVDSLVPASRYSFRNQGRALMHICSYAVLNISIHASRLDLDFAISLNI
jgi:hypothetical protein